MGNLFSGLVPFVPSPRREPGVRARGGGGRSPREPCGGRALLSPASSDGSPGPVIAAVGPLLAAASTGVGASSRTLVTLVRISILHDTQRPFVSKQVFKLAAGIVYVLPAPPHARQRRLPEPLESSSLPAEEPPLPRATSSVSHACAQGTRAGAPEEEGGPGSCPRGSRVPSPCLGARTSRPQGGFPWGRDRAQGR